MTQQTVERGVRNPDHHVWVEPSPKWVRVLAGGETVVDTKHALLLRETGHTPVYYFPMDDVRMELFERTDRSTHCPYKGDAIYWTLRVGDRVEENAVWSYPVPLDDEAPDLSGYAAFYWNKFDAWYEENEQVYVHARDPYKRIDVLPSTRHVTVAINGDTVAETQAPTLLFETGLPVRYYIPMLDVRQDLLVPTDQVTRCPYKGQAGYYSVQAGGELLDDIAWYYRYPIPEATGIAGLVAFFNERVDTTVDGELQERPQTKWSRG